ncbi:hypothetical protein D9V34_04190 [Mycetocola lacteus]|uniref:Uncharacterized protein n=1 Tax=Mycetocola lacteus TaxID=76637 RepID=A0A3L7AU66_9MICO|nr:hypothetical protein D9V34_04190 [Mycetocola lacteus]
MNAAISGCFSGELDGSGTGNAGSRRDGTSRGDVDGHSGNRSDTGRIQRNAPYLTAHARVKQTKSTEHLKQILRMIDDCVSE